MAARLKSIAVIGGGFSGATTAINLARLSQVSLQITVINQRHPVGRGLAYDTRRADRLLNVVARNMSALADEPNHFVEWLGTRSEYLDDPHSALRERFVPRRVYGDYLQSLFQWYCGTCAHERDTRIEIVHGEATDIAIEDQRAQITLAGGRIIAADKVVLAVGNQSPVFLPVHGLNPQSLKYIGNPWIGWEEKLPSKDQDLLLVGTGLTMADNFLALQELGWRGRIMAISRSGLLPLSHFKGFEYPVLLDDESAVGGLRKIFSIFKQHYRTTRARNLNPAILIDKLRPFTQRVWQNFSLFEKRQFNRHFRSHWNFMRHRLAPEVHQQLCEAILSGRLEIIKGRLLECEESNDKLRILVESCRVKSWIEVGALINCTGPRESYLPSESSLFNNLFSRGLIEPDEMDMGIKVAPNFSVTDRRGNDSEILYALGALLKGTLWETTAVPELRSQAFRLAEIIADQLDGNVTSRSPITEVVEDVLEYSI
jgi:uncharacterized NAD(P)/FAD-binding protein YdhS